MGVGKRALATWCILAASVTFLGVLLVKRLWFSPSAVQAATRLLDCVNAFDANCVSDFVTADEESAAGLTERRLALVMAQYVAPAVRSCKRVDSGLIDTAPSVGQVSLSDVYARSDGHKVGLGLSVQPTEEGLKSRGVLISLLNAAVEINYYKHDAKYNQSIARSLAWLEFLKRDRGSFEAWGLKGVWRESEMRMATWDELERVHKKKLADLNIPVP